MKSSCTTLCSPSNPSNGVSNANNLEQETVTDIRICDRVITYRLCGFEPTPEYVEVLRDLDGASICPPGIRPSASDPYRYYAPFQNKRHRMWSPLGFRDLCGIDEPKPFMAASKTLVFSLSSLEPKPDPDVEAVINHIVKLGPGQIGVGRFEQRARIRRCIKKLEPLSTAMRAARPNTM